jgi:5-methylcytosine-specific restriction enzyme A
MSQYAIIAQNDESQWEDIKGEIYQFPNMYKHILTPGCKVIYYKGRLRDKKFINTRLSIEAHYFGIGEIGKVVKDPGGKKGDLFCEILNYQEFSDPVPIKINDLYIENIPESKQTNYWRFGVREIDSDTYNKILNLAKIPKTATKKIKLPSISGEFESTRKDGAKKLRYTTYYERNPFKRTQAIKIHGLNCMVCGCNFEEQYGPLGKGFIHVHHIKPVSELFEAKLIDPEVDLVVLCPNCHAMIHRDKENTLSIEELKAIFKGAKR